MPRLAALLVLALGLLAASPALATLPPADAALEAKAVAYLQGLASVRTRFEQIDPRGDVAHGMLYLARPGRARFQYAPPSGLLITSDGKTVTVSDSRRGTFHHYPLRSTPLGVFLAERIRLDRGAKVTAVTPTAAGFDITARDVRGEGRGQITLDFAEHPMRLTGWSIVDATRKLTRVELSGLEPIPTPPASLFVQTRSRRRRAEPMLRDRHN
ncbi:MAG TPA: outer-membrane lipoprotein carrier protein LolA [Caulobacteraceae bacterium]|nr:outer-membrane lipoprotein carrier protein LolA [Caulobacteraceae bacterium]